MGRHRRRGRRSESSPCPPLTDPNLVKELVMVGGNLSSSAQKLDGAIEHTFGTILKVTCEDGFELAPPHKKRIKCGRKSGKWMRHKERHSYLDMKHFDSGWRPGIPACLPRKCRLPPIEEGGRYKMGTTQLPDEGEIAHGKTVELECDPGYRR